MYSLANNLDKQIRQSEQNSTSSKSNVKVSVTSLIQGGNSTNVASTPATKSNVCKVGLNKNVYSPTSNENKIINLIENIETKMKHC